MSPPTSLALCASSAAVSIVCRARMRSRKPGAKRSIWASIRSVMSTREPLGTWQYAQPVCFPWGARVGSAVVACTNRTYGRSACPPEVAARSLATTSALVPHT